MIPTRSARQLLVCAMAFSVGSSVSVVLAQQGTSNDPRSPRLRGAARQPVIIVTRNGTPQARQDASQPTAPTPAPSPAPAPTQTPTVGSSNTNASNALPPPPAADRRPNRRALRTNLTAPSSVRAARTVSNGSISLTWVDTNSSESGFIIQRQEFVNNRWVNAKEYSVGPNTVFFEEVVPVGTYAYRVAAQQGSSNSLFSEWTLVQVLPVLSAPTPPAPSPSTPPPQGGQSGGPGGTPTTPPTPPTPPAEAPAAPSGVVLSDLGDRSARVQWSPVSGAVSYRVERNPAFAEGVRSVDAAQTSFVDATGVGTFRYRVRAIGTGGQSAFSEWMPVQVRDIVPVAPGALGVVDMGDHERVRLAWEDRSDNEYRFRIERESVVGDDSPVLRTILANANTSELIDFPGPGTHRYRIAASNAIGTSAFGDWVLIAIQAPVSPTTPDAGETGTPPSAPSSILAVSPSPRSVALSWGDASSDETGFEIERNPAFPEGLRVAGANATSLTDSVTPGDYAYRVRSVNADGRSEFTAWATVDVSDHAPAVPANVAVVVSQGDVSVSWQDASANETSFEAVFEEYDNGQWTAWGSQAALANSAGLTLKMAPGSYRVRVSAINAYGSGDSGWVTFTVDAPVDPMTIVPQPPVGTVVVEQSRRAAIAWTDASSNELGFEVERSPSFESRVLLGANAGAYVDNCGSGTYSYRVRSFNNAGYSAWSSWASITIAELSPSAPSAVSAIDAGNQRDVRVTWVDASNNELGFRLERSDWVNGAWTTPSVQTLAANTTSIIDAPGMGRFRYRLQSFNASGDSAWSDYGVASITDGWTQVVKSPDTREVFVSSTLGNDNNSGLSPDQPIRTLSKAYYTVRDGMPDHIRLRRGDVWTGEQMANGYGGWDKHGRSATEPMVIYTYGDAAARPLIRAGQHGTVMLIMGNDTFNGNLNLIGLHFQANRRMVGDPNFTPDEGATGLRWYALGGNFLVEDCYFEGFTGNLSIESPLTANAPGSPITNWVRNVVIRRSVFVDAYATNTSHSQGLYFSMVDGLLVDECVVDHNGWSTTVPNRPSTIFNHNFYIQPNVTNAMIRNTISARAAATAVQCRGRKQDVFNVLAIDSPLSITAGHGSTRMPDQAWTGTFSYNVTLGSRDIGVNNSYPRGFGMTFGTSNGGILEKNIIAHNTTTIGGEPALSSDGVTQNSIVRDNIIYNWTGLRNVPNRGLAVRIIGNPNADFRFENNTIQQPNGGTMIQIRNATESGTWRNNKMYSTTPGDLWFSRFGTGEFFNMPSWYTRTGQSGLNPSVQDRVEQVTFPDPNRSIASYMQTLGYSGSDASTEKFLSEARKMSRNNWRPEFTAAAVNRYIREGFGMPEPTPQTGQWAAGEAE